MNSKFFHLCLFHIGCDNGVGRREVALNISSSNMTYFYCGCIIKETLHACAFLSQIFLGMRYGVENILQIDC